MKCKYGEYCKHGGNVEKDKAIKIDKSYYHEDCYDEMNEKKIIRNKIIELLPREVMMNINKVIKDLLYTKLFDSKYILYILDYIKYNNAKLNSAYGIIYYLNNTKIKLEYDKKVANINAKIISEKINECILIDEVKFDYKPNKPKYLNIF